MKNIFNKFDAFHVIFIIFGVFFSFMLFLSIPSLFDYKNIKSNIEDKIESNFEIKIQNIQNIKYRFVPTPHLLLENADLYLNDGSNNKISSLENAKIFISLLKLYNGREISIKKIELKNENINLSVKNFFSFLDHLYKKKNKTVLIKKSKLFILDNKEKVIAISPIYKSQYFFNENSKQKRLKILGNLFDTDYDFSWVRDFKNPDNSSFELKFKNPNILFENSLEKKNDKKKKGTVKISFLDNKIDIDYEYNKKKVFIETNKNLANRFNIKGNIELDPFYFNLTTYFEKQNIDFFIKTILLNYFNSKNNVHPNLSGDLKVEISKINNAFFRSGYINFKINNSKIILNDNKINLTKIGSLFIKENLFYENKGNIFFATKLELDIVDQKEFYRRFLIPIKNRKDIKKIYAIVEKNIDNDNFFISNISLNNDFDFKFNIDNINNLDKVEFDNFQKFRNIIKYEFSQLN